MLTIHYKHPLHGNQKITCKELINKEGVLHAINIHGVTFQTLNPVLILSVGYAEE